MFAAPASAPSHEPSLASRVFGRFVVQHVQVGTVQVESMATPALQSAAADDDNVPDLAQRVREVGEW